MMYKRLKLLFLFSMFMQLHADNVATPFINTDETNDVCAYLTEDFRNAIMELNNCAPDHAWS